MREAAGDRLADIELHWLTTLLAITDDPEAVARDVIEGFRGFGQIDIGVEEVLASPHILIGSEDAIVEVIQQRREEYGVSYISVFASEREAFAPVVARQAGT